LGHQISEFLLKRFQVPLSIEIFVDFGVDESMR